MIANIIVIAPATDLLDDHSQQQKTVIAVSPPAPGREFEAALPVKRYVVLKRAQLFAMRVELRTEEVSGAACMRKQVMDCHLGNELFIRIIGNILYQRIGQLDLAGLNELKNRNGGEHLVHRSDTKARVQFVGNLLL